MSIGGRGGGHIKLHRQVETWPLWQAMTALQRMVWVQVLFAANWKPSKAWVSGKTVEIPRGSFIEGQDSIATRAGVSRKVVRQTYEHLLSEGALTQAVIGHQQGHGVVLTTVVNYSEYQDAPEREGRRRAAGGPQEGHGRAPSEEGEAVEAVKQETPTPPAPAPAPSRAVTLRSALVEAFEARRGCKYAFGGARDGAALKALMALTEYDGEILKRWKQGLAGQGWKQVSTIAQLLSKWNDLTAPEVAPTQTRPITRLRPLGAPGA